MTKEKGKTGVDGVLGEQEDGFEKVNASLGREMRRFLVNGGDFDEGMEKIRKVFADPEVEVKKIARAKDRRLLKAAKEFAEVVKYDNFIMGCIYSSYSRIFGELAIDISVSRWC